MIVIVKTFDDDEHYPNGVISGDLYSKLLSMGDKGLSQLTQNYGERFHLSFIRLASHVTIKPACRNPLPLIVTEQ